MIKELIPNKIYYRGNTKPPFYTEEMATVINDDGTFGDATHPRINTIEIALKYWCETKEEAVENMISYYFTLRNYKEDFNNKSDVYRDFVNDMKEYLIKQHPEYLV